MAKRVMRKKISKKESHTLKQQEEFKSRTAKRIFFIFLDVIILVCFSLAIYFTLVMDYTKVILFLVMGSLLLLFFIIRKLVKRR